MKHLEDVIARILGLRIAGESDAAIAAKLKLSLSKIQEKEEALTRKIVKMRKKQGANIQDIADALNFSPQLVQMYATYHNIDLTRGGRVPYKVRIQKAIEEGARTAREVSQRTGIALGYVYLCAKKSGIPLKRRPYAKNKVAAVKDAVIAGKPLEQIAGEQKIALGTVRAYAYKTGLSLAGGQKTVQIIGEAFARKDPYALQEIFSKTKITPETLAGYCYLNKIAIPENLVPYRGLNPTLDKLIDEGLMVGEIEERTGVNRGSFYRYIVGTGQHSRWKIARENVRLAQQLKLPAIEDLARALKEVALHRAEREISWGYRKALEYEDGHTPEKRRIPRDKLVTLFDTYHQAKTAGQRLTLKELGQASGIAPTTISFVLDRLGVEPMNPPMSTKAHREKRISVDQKIMLARAYSLPMIVSDIAHFASVRYQTAIGFYKYERPADKRYYLGFIDREKVMYRQASQVYEAEDCGFAPSDISQLLDLNQPFVDFILQSRKEFEPKIIDCLRVIYANKELNKPYLQRQ